MEKWNVILTDKKTGTETFYGEYKSEREAEEICERWGWNYDDGKKSYWMGYEKA